MASSYVFSTDFIHNVSLNRTYDLGRDFYCGDSCRNLKFITIIAFIAGYLLGCMIAIIIGSYLMVDVIEKHYSFLILRAFTAGAMISVAFSHLLTSASQALSGMYPSFEAIPLAICICGIFLVLAIEQSLFAIIKYREDLNVMLSDDDDNGSESSNRRSNTKNENLSNTLIIVKLYTMQISVAIHSIIIGISIGMMSESNLDEISVVAIAMTLHQFFEGLSLGCIFSKARNKLGIIKIISFTIFFALTVPIGIIIGMDLIHSLDINTHKLATGISNAFGAGALLYIGLVQMIAKYFSRHDVMNNHILKFSMIISFGVGNAIMAMIGFETDGAVFEGIE
jgi:zinc transporter ZupT